MEESAGNEPEDSRPVCLHGIQCKEVGMDHFTSFRHLQTANEEKARFRAKSRRRERTDGSSKVDPPSKKANLHRPAMYVTKVPGISPCFNEPSVAIHIRDILHTSMGNLVSSAHFNYMFDINWLIQQYPVEFRSKPILVIHGEQRSSKSELEKECQAYSNIQLIQAPLPFPFGKHHSKMILLLYDTGMRVVIHTANLIPRDWELKTQGVWVSPVFPKGDKLSDFQSDLLAYLSAYNRSGLDTWRRHVSSHDMSDANVHLIASVPGRHLGQHINTWGHMKLRRILKRNVSVSNEWPAVAQFSSIGSLGSNPRQWLSGEFCGSLSSSTTSLQMTETELCLIFPSVMNVRRSLEGYMAGGSLPYHSKTAEKQTYLKRFLHQWRADCMGRSRASPHIKTYTRLSPDGKRIAWFLLTR